MAKRTEANNKDLVERTILSLNNMHRAILSYIYEGDRSAYQTVATELRKLLLDSNAPRSWEKRTRRRSLFELVHGRREEIYVSGSPSDGSVPSFIHPELMPAYAGSDNRPETMHDWLKRKHVTSPDGSARTHETLLKDIADKEGAHIIGNRAIGWKGFGIGFISAGADDHEEGHQVMEMWRQLVVFAGCKLLMAREYRRGMLEPLFSYQWPDWERRITRPLPDPDVMTISLVSGVELCASVYSLPGTNLSGPVKPVSMTA